MPYTRRNFRSSRRRYRRKNSLSNYNIATRTSARSQANQIYRLKRRINSIERRTKPEIKLWERSYAVSTPTGTQLPNSSILVSYTSTDNSWNTQFDGNFARFLSLTFYFSSSYTNYAASTPPITFRVVILQTRTTRDSEIEAADVFSGISESTSLNPMPNSSALGSLSGPLQQGLARTAKVLCDRKFYLSYQRPQIMSTIKLKGLLNYYRNEATTGDTESVGKGKLYMFVLAYNPGNSVTYTFTAQSKLAYTDA